MTFQNVHNIFGNPIDNSIIDQRNDFPQMFPYSNTPYTSQIEHSLLSSSIYRPTATANMNMTAAVTHEPFISFDNIYTVPPSAFAMDILNTNHHPQLGYGFIHKNNGFTHEHFTFNHEQSFATPMPLQLQFPLPANITHQSLSSTPVSNIMTNSLRDTPSSSLNRVKLETESAMTATSTICTAGDSSFTSPTSSLLYTGSSQTHRQKVLNSLRPPNLMNMEDEIEVEFPNSKREPSLKNAREWLEIVQLRWASVHQNRRQRFPMRKFSQDRNGLQKYCSRNYRKRVKYKRQKLRNIKHGQIRNRSQSRCLSEVKMENNSSPVNCNSLVNILQIDGKLEVMDNVYDGNHGFVRGNGNIGGNEENGQSLFSSLPIFDINHTDMKCLHLENSFSPEIKTRFSKRLLKKQNMEKMEEVNNGVFHERSLIVISDSD